MVCIEEINKMVEKDLDDFYNDRDRFKGVKLLLDFKSSDYNIQNPEIKMNSPKFKKKLVVSKFIKINKNSNSLF